MNEINEFIKTIRDENNQKHRDFLITAIDFFIIFSRFEYALKSNKLAKNDSNYVEADWDTFISQIEIQWNEIDWNSSSNNELKGCKKTLLNYPPHTQTLNNHIAEFKRQPIRKGNASDLEFLLRCIKTIRNNLFHGGKNTATEMCNNRDKILIDSSIQILTVWLKFASDDIRKCFSSIN